MLGRPPVAMTAFLNLSFTPLTSTVSLSTNLPRPEAKKPKEVIVRYHYVK